MTAPDLDGLVQVEPADDAHGAHAFRGRAVPGAYGRTFGGQLLGQAVTAATATLEPTDERLAHSLHAYFVSPGDASEPIEYAVRPVRDGRSFSVRSVEARQGDRPLLTAALSFQVPSGGLTHQTALEDGYPDPETLAQGDGDFAPPHRAPGTAGHRDAVEIRRIPADLDPVSRSSGQALWVRAAAPRAPGTARTDRAVLALVSDFTLLESTVIAHGMTFATPGLAVASLDHSLWWHAPATLDDWLLYTQDSHWSGGQRALVTGRLHDRDGRLVATVVQEGLVRVAEPAT